MNIKVAAFTVSEALSNISMFYIKYRNAQSAHACWCNKAVNVWYAYIREIIHPLKLVDYLPVHTHKSYNNLHLYPDDGYVYSPGFTVMSLHSLGSL